MLLSLELLFINVLDVENVSVFVFRLTNSPELLFNIGLNMTLSGIGYFCYKESMGLTFCT